MTTGAPPAPAVRPLAWRWRAASRIALPVALLVLWEAAARLGDRYSVRRFDELYFQGDAKEAVAFALLGYLTIHGQPGNLPAATGLTAGKRRPERIRCSGTTGQHPKKQQGRRNDNSSRCMQCNPL